ncbi:SAM-dependent methyltransferase [Oleisolibacter albus]|uniref:SAM-dependent methyltransferase n=1 Tax=Oleisolibacter albus TaxID=2171757 RepID=UPI000DF188E0|nr:cyclopropane-fatty-acyl-phospholipid synthase family protein [Oleisolibacter albus]
MLFARLLRGLVKSGGLTLIDAKDRIHTIGCNDGRAPPLRVRLTESSLHWKLAVNPGLYAGEAYMDGTLRIEEGTIFDLLDLVTRNAGTADLGSVARLRGLIIGLARLVQQTNPLDRSRRNVAHHYDLSGALYDLFLDADRQYSCAYFTEPGQPLEQAQAAKKRHIAAKLLLQPGQRVLDIGCGWGGLALTLARLADVEVLGVTLSKEQLAVARQRAAAAGLDGRVRFELRDYRELDDRFDRIVSVGMFEHVGRPQYGTFFHTVRRLLAEDGVALLHSIGRMDGPGITNPWIRKYIFPGGYSPALSEVVPAVERSQLWITDVEVLRLHYAETLRQWRQRFQAQRAAAAALYDERFCRLWEFYLAGCECAFRHQGHMVFQMQLARRVDAVPLTRTYMATEEQALARRDRSADGTGIRAVSPAARMARS